MKYKNTVLIVSDMEKSKEFYHEVMGLHIIIDLKASVTLSSGICLQSLETWKDFIHKNDDEITMMNHACELYFENDDIDEFLVKLNQHQIPLVHGLKEHRFGQRVIRFYDPDGHMIEVGESLKKIIKRFLSQGLSHEEISRRMDIPLKLVEKITNG